MWSGVLVVRATEWRSGRQSEGEKTKRQGHYLVRILAWDAGDGELGCTHFLWRGWLLQGGCVFYFVWWASRKTMRRRRGFGSLLGLWFGRHLRQFLWGGWLLWGGVYFILLVTIIIVNWKKARGITDDCLQAAIAIPLFTDLLVWVPVLNVRQKQISNISLLIFLCGSHDKYSVNFITINIFLLWL